jgi:hypothetical protein
MVHLQDSGRVVTVPIRKRPAASSEDRRRDADDNSETEKGDRKKKKADSADKDKKKKHSLKQLQVKPLRYLSEDTSITGGA